MTIKAQTADGAPASITYDVIDQRQLLGGGVDVIRQYLAAGLVDEMHLAVSPVTLGTGEHLLTGLDIEKCGLDEVEYLPTDAVAHYLLKRGA